MSSVLWVTISSGDGCLSTFPQILYISCRFLFPSSGYHKLLLTYHDAFVIIPDKSSSYLAVVVGGLTVDVVEGLPTIC